jgi:hypothetical protein
VKLDFLLVLVLMLDSCECLGFRAVSGSGSGSGSGYPVVSCKLHLLNSVLIMVRNTSLLSEDEDRCRRYPFAVVFQ